MPPGFWLPNPGLRIMLSSLGTFQGQTLQRGGIQGSPLPCVSASQCLYVAGKAPNAGSEQNLDVTNK